MYPLLPRSRSCRLHTHSLSFCSDLIDRSLLSNRPLCSAKAIHAVLIKLGFNRNTFLGNRCVDLYSKVGASYDALGAFDDIDCKNIVSWNVCLKVFVKLQDFGNARKLFDGMSEKDIVSWNSMISGYVTCRCLDKALELFMEMRQNGVRPSVYTYSTLVSCVESRFYGKVLHGSMLRSGVDLSNVVVGNCLIGMYGKVGLVCYAIAIFRTMEKVDLVSWNTLISGLCKAGHNQLALDQFYLMRYRGYGPDEFTISAVFSACSNLQDREKGEQIYCLCIKMGFLSNSIVSSAIIDLFSKCNKLENSVLVFSEFVMWDSALCNSMISSYARHNLEDDALRIFVHALREDIRPTEFTLSCILNCAPVFFPVQVGCQFHSLVIKYGFEIDPVVACSLIEMYSKSGSVNSALYVFANMDVRDLISWNMLINGLISNGNIVDCFRVLSELLESDQQPDCATLAGILRACNHSGLLAEGMAIFSSMEEQFGLKPTYEHYACVVEMMIQANKLDEMIELLEMMPPEAIASVWESALCASQINGDLKLIERVVERITESQPHLSQPYMVLAQAYEQSSRWEKLVRVRRFMQGRGIKKVDDCTRIGIRNGVFSFREKDIFHSYSEDVYSISRLLTLEIWDSFRLINNIQEGKASDGEG